jgi:hypothetical protein
MVYAGYFITGILAGIVGGLFGTGGCTLMMPVIRFGFNLDPAPAVGTTLTAVFITAASGAIQHRRKKNADSETALLKGDNMMPLLWASEVFAEDSPGVTGEKERCSGNARRCSGEWQR